MYNSGEHFLARQSSQRKMSAHLLADRREAFGERKHMMVFCALADLAKTGVIAVLLTAFGIAASCLNMAVRLGADPHVGPSGWYRQRLDPLQDGCFVHLAAIRSYVTKPLSGTVPTDAGPVVADVSKPRVLGGLLWINHRLGGTQIKGHRPLLKPAPWAKRIGSVTVRLTTRRCHTKRTRTAPMVAPMKPAP